MKYSSSSPPVSCLDKLIPERFAEHFEGPPLLPFESREEFDELFSHLIVEFSPKSLIDFELVHDLAILLWVIKRLRGMGLAIVESEIPPAATRLIGETVTLTRKSDGSESEVDVASLFDEVVRGDLSNEKLINAIAGEAGVSSRKLFQEAYRSGLKMIAIIDEKISKAEHQRDRLIRLLEDRRRMAVTAGHFSRTADPIDVVDATAARLERTP